VIARVATLLHPILLHQDEGAEQNALDGDDHGEQDEGVGIEVRKERKNLAVDEKPADEDHHVNDDEPDTSAEAADYVGDEVLRRAALLEAPFEIGDGADIGFDRGRSGLGCLGRHARDRCGGGKRDDLSPKETDRRFSHPGSKLMR